MRSPFVSDGCSGGMSWAWRKALGVAPPWEGCCVEHDRAYWRGGSYDERAIADRRLMICVVENGHPFWAFAMYLAVRLGGSPFLPLPWRWGFGDPPNDLTRRHP